MSKVKIIQIALAAAGDMMGGKDVYAEYLDDHGRVWTQNYTHEKDPDTGAEVREYYWEQVDLPDEPEAKDVPF